MKPYNRNGRMNDNYLELAKSFLETDPRFRTLAEDTRSTGKMLEDLAWSIFTTRPEDEPIGYNAHDMRRSFMNWDFTLQIMRNEVGFTFIPTMDKIEGPSKAEADLVTA